MWAKRGRVVLSKNTDVFGNFHQDFEAAKNLTSNNRKFSSDGIYRKGMKEV